MLVTIYNTIRNRQKELFRQLGLSKENVPVLGAAEAPEHKPEMLMIGCVDARLNLKDDVGIPDGKALIYRNIAAMVPHNFDEESGKGVAAALEFAIDKMHVKRIVVMGHTHCGGIAACLTGDHEHTHHIRNYLAPLEVVREEAVGKGETLEEQARDMERAAVCQSLENLKSYGVVRRAVEERQLILEGWIIDTGSKLIWEHNPNTGEFVPMGLPMQAQDRVGNSA
ncbi:MAG: carbonic anhydrase [Rickettsiales bacterium]